MTPRLALLATVASLVLPGFVCAAEEAPVTSITSWTAGGRWPWTRGMSDVKKNGSRSRPLRAPSRPRVPWIIQEAFPDIMAWPGTGTISPPRSAPRHRPLSAAVLGRGLSGRSVAQRSAGGRARGGETPLCSTSAGPSSPGRRTESSCACSTRPTNRSTASASSDGPPLQGDPVSRRAGFNHGGITDSVELLCVP